MQTNSLLITSRVWAILLSMSLLRRDIDIRPVVPPPQRRCAGVKDIEGYEAIRSGLKGPCHKESVTEDPRDKTDPSTARCALADEEGPADP